MFWVYLPLICKLDKNTSAPIFISCSLLTFNRPLCALSCCELDERVDTLVSWSQYTVCGRRLITNMAGSDSGVINYCPLTQVSPHCCTNCCSHDFLPNIWPIIISTNTGILNTRISGVHLICKMLFMGGYLIQF